MNRHFLVKIALKTVIHVLSNLSASTVNRINLSQVTNAFHVTANLMGVRHVALIKTA